MQSRENKNALQLVCQKLDKEKDYIIFCLVCKLWSEAGFLSKNVMADKFKMYCYKQTKEWANVGEHYIKLIEYWHLNDDKLHGPWKLTITYNEKKKELIRYIYSFGKLVEMASQEEIHKMYNDLGLTIINQQF